MQFTFVSCNIYLNKGFTKKCLTDKGVKSVLVQCDDHFIDVHFVRTDVQRLEKFIYFFVVGISVPDSLGRIRESILLCTQDIDVALDYQDEIERRLKIFYNR